MARVGCEDGKDAQAGKVSCVRIMGNMETKEVSAMGYDIYIGNTEMEMLDEDDECITPHFRIIEGKTRYYKPVVRKRIQQPDAPTFPNDEMTGNSSDRHPGYGQWSGFLTMTGLYSLFFNKRHGLMREHPGYTELKSWHAEEISRALSSFKERYPQATPRFGATLEDANLARLIWLDWWVKWVLKNCEHAGIYNF